MPKCHIRIKIKSNKTQQSRSSKTIILSSCWVSLYICNNILIFILSILTNIVGINFIWQTYEKKVIRPVAKARACDCKRNRLWVRPPLEDSRTQCFQNLVKSGSDLIRTKFLNYWFAFVKCFYFLVHMAISGIKYFYDYQRYIQDNALKKSECNLLSLSWLHLRAIPIIFTHNSTYVHKPIFHIF